ncbi:MAG: restriction endonuclease [Solirubrobacteraceae bacterium]
MASPVLGTVSHGDPRVWALMPGEAIERTTLHERYGGRTQGRIVPSRSSPNIMVFADPQASEAPGAVDGWRADGCLHYTGEGQRGDQLMKSGNAAIFNHVDTGRAVRLFRGTRDQVVYEGEFTLDAETPFYTTDAPEIRHGPMRSVIVFRLRPLDTRPRPSTSPLDLVNRAVVEEVPIEEQRTERAFLAPDQKADEAERREHALLLAFRDHLLRKGHDVCRLKLVPPGEAKPLFSDLMDRTTNTLFEAKGTVERGSIRMAVGQLLDYSRFVQPRPRMAVLVPTPPREDLRAFLRSAGVEIVWRDGRRFRDSAGEA